MPDRPPTLSYRSPGDAAGRPSGGDYSDVANGFLSAFVAVPLGVAGVMAGLRGDRLSAAVVGGGLVVVAVGVGFGLRRGAVGLPARGGAVRRAGDRVRRDCVGLGAAVKAGRHRIPF